MTGQFFARLRRYLSALLIGVPTLAVTLYTGSLLLFDPGFARSSELGCAALEWAALRWPPVQNSAAVRILVAPLARDPSGTFTSMTKSVINQKLGDDPRVQVVEHCRPVQPIGTETRPKKKIAIQNADNLLRAYSADAIVWGQVRHANGQDVLDIRIQIPGDDGGQEVDGSGAYTIAGPDLKIDGGFSDDAGLAIYAQIFSNLQSYLAQRSDGKDGIEEQEHWQSRRDYYTEVIRYKLLPELISAFGRLKEFAKDRPASGGLPPESDRDTRFALLYNATIRIFGTNFEMLRDYGTDEDAYNLAKLLDYLFSIKPVGSVSDFCECLEGSVNSFLAGKKRLELKHLADTPENAAKSLQIKNEIKQRLEKSTNNFGAAASIIVREKSTESYLRWALYKGNEGLSAQERFFEEPDLAFANRALTAFHEALAIEEISELNPDHVEDIGDLWVNNSMRIIAFHFNLMENSIDLLTDDKRVKSLSPSDIGIVVKQIIQSSDFLIRSAETSMRYLGKDGILPKTIDAHEKFSFVRPFVVFQRSLGYLRQGQFSEDVVARRKSATLAKEGFESAISLAKDRLLRPTIAESQRVFLESVIIKQSRALIPIAEQLLADAATSPSTAGLVANLGPAVGFTFASLPVKGPFNLNEPLHAVTLDDAVMASFLFKREENPSSSILPVPTETHPSPD